MTVIRHQLPLPLARFPLPAGIEVRGWAGTPADRDRLVALAVACRAGTGAGGGPALRGSGLLGELQSRSGRRVEAWLALDTGAAGASGDCRGLVTLVETIAGWSIGWLLVHPHERRQGLGRGLVSIAAAAAHSRGAQSLCAETLGGWPAASVFWRSLEAGSRATDSDGR